MTSIKRNQRRKSKRVNKNEKEKIKRKDIMQKSERKINKNK